MPRLETGLLLAALVLGGCAADTADQLDERGQTESVPLGPVDGRDLPGVDLERVQVGDVAPDFSLVSLAGPVVTLSSFRGQKNVVLVFYRGWW